MSQEDGIYEVTTDVKPEEVITVPEQIIFPVVRYAAPSGTLTPEYHIIKGNVTVENDAGDVKPLEFKGFKIDLNNFPSDPNTEILAVLYMDFTTSTIAVVPVVEPPVEG